MHFLNKNMPFIGAITVLLYTYYVGSFFIGGDQIAYRYVYNSLPDYGFFQGYQFYTSKILTKEFGHYIITWLASHFFDKDIFNAFSNAFLGYFSIKLFMKWGAFPLLAFVLVVFGYYFLAVYVSSDRLKYGSLFFVISMLYIQNPVKSYAFLMIALVTHMQYIIIVALASISANHGSLLRTLHTGLIKKSFLIKFFFAFSFMFLLIFYFQDHILHKIKSYSDSFGPDEFYRIVLFFFLSLFYSKHKLQVIIVFIVLFLSVYMVGGMRVNLFGYFVFLYYALKVNRGFNLGVIATTAYYFTAWVEYVSLVLEYGVNRAPISI